MSFAYLRHGILHDTADGSNTVVVEKTLGGGRGDPRHSDLGDQDTTAIIRRTEPGLTGLDDEIDQGEVPADDGMYCFGPQYINMLIGAVPLSMWRRQQVFCHLAESSQTTTHG